LRPLGERCGELSELRADAAALRASGGDAAPLAAALLAFDAGAPSGAAGISPERVDWMLGQPSRWRLPRWLLIASLVTLSGLIIVVWRAGAAASTNATLNLPGLSSQPCLMVLALVAVLAGTAALWRRHAGPGGVLNRPG
jgi:hypothetical protein